MPQLDKVTFLSQFFWLCLFYLGFYYLVLKYFLPKISRILTLRKRKINLSQYGSKSEYDFHQENHQVRQNLDTLLSRGFSLSINVFNDFLSRTNNWLDRSSTGLNKTHYKAANNGYIKSLGETSLSQNIYFYHASTSLPETLKAQGVLDQIRKLRNLRNTPVSISQPNKIKDQKVSNQEVSNQEVSNQEVSNKKVSNKKVSNKKVSNKKVSNQEVPNQEATKKPGPVQEFYTRPQTRKV